MSRPSGVVRSSARLRLPRFECSSRAWTSPLIDTTPVAARPRMASPRSIGSILITSAPQSARSAEAAGTNVCSAASRTRTPSITAVTKTLPLSARPGCPPSDRRNPILTSTSTIVLWLSRPAPRDGPASATWGHLEEHLPHGPAVGHVAQGRHHVRQVELAADEGGGPALGQELEELAVVAGHVRRLVRREVPELEPEDVDALQQNQVERYPGD